MTPKLYIPLALLLVTACSTEPSPSAPVDPPASTAAQEAPAAPTPPAEQPPPASPAPEPAKEPAAAQVQDEPAPQGKSPRAGQVDSDKQAQPSSTPKPAPSAAHSMHEHSNAASASPSSAALTRVEPSKVCMVNNAYMGREQIPVEVEGKTYFGCCEMCKGRLSKDPSSRVATDPVSGKTVDKASAVIGKDGSGAVVYFESEKNFVAYASR